MIEPMTLGAAADSDVARTFVRAQSLNLRQRVILPGLLLCAARALIEKGASRDRVCRAFFVPGRVELFGKHTDYGGGPSIVCAIERGVVVIASARSDDAVHIVDARTGESVAAEPGTSAGHTGPTWSHYTGAVARRLARDFPETWCGADIAFFSNLPMAAGLSSSTALVVATFLALDSVQHISDSVAYTELITSREQLAEYLAAVEAGAPFRGLDAHDGAGTMSGSEDHTALLCGEAGQVLQYSYLPATRDASVHCPSKLTFAIATSGVMAEKGGRVMEHYNRLALQVRQLEELWHRHDGERATLRGILNAPLGAERLRDIVTWHAGAHADELLARLAQFQQETTDIIPRALDALRGSDYASLRSLAERSQQLAEGVLRNQVEETIWLAGNACSYGAVAASAFGAGFGGSVWALVERERAAAFLDAWRDAYIAQFPQHAKNAEFWFTDPGCAAIDITGAALS